jgi:hypothetical protein
MAASHSHHTAERVREALNGWFALTFLILWLGAALALFSTIGPDGDGVTQPQAVVRAFAALLMIGLGVFACFGFFTLEPNEARVLILFGAYKGSVRKSGFHWANPLYARSRGAAPDAPPVHFSK